VGREAERFAHDDLRFRARDEHPTVHLQHELAKGGRPNGVGERLTAQPPVQGPFNGLRLTGP
jgi:hypothetical protein